MEAVIIQQNKKFYFTKKFHDISFIFPNVSNDIQKIHANKVILAQASPVFEAMFFGDLAETRNPFPFVDVEPEIFKLVLQFIYTRQLTQNDFKEFEQLYLLANRFQIIGLEAACEEFLTRNMTKFDLTDVSNFCDMFNRTDLKRLCELYMTQGIRRKAEWKKFKKDEPLPSGIFIADYDAEGWPLGVARYFNGEEFKTGTFYIKKSFACTGHWVSSETHTENFEVLCHGNFEWVRSKQGEVLKKSVIVGRYSVGKIMDQNEVFIGSIEPAEKCLWIFYTAGGGARISDNYYQLIDNFNENEKNPPLYLQELNHFTYNLTCDIQSISKNFWRNEKYEDIEFVFTHNPNKIIRANSVILAQASSFFEKLVTEETKQQILVNEKAAEGFEALLTFIYTSEIPRDSLLKIEHFLIAADCYEIYCVTKICETFLMKNLKNFPLSELTRLAETFFMSDLVKLCKLHERNATRTNVISNWVKWETGNALPSGTFFADYDEDGWPIAVGRCFSLPGTLSLKDMTLLTGTNAVSYKHQTRFEILCDGNLEWVQGSNGTELPQSVLCGWSYCIGKYRQEGKMFIAKIQPLQKCAYVAYRQGESRIASRYLHLIDKNIVESERRVEYGYSSDEY